MNDRQSDSARGAVRETGAKLVLERGPPARRHLGRETQLQGRGGEAAGTHGVDEDAEIGETHYTLRRHAGQSQQLATDR